MYLSFVLSKLDLFSHATFSPHKHSWNVQYLFLIWLRDEKPVSRIPSVRSWVHEPRSARAQFSFCLMMMMMMIMIMMMMMMLGSLWYSSVWKMLRGVTSNPNLNLNNGLLVGCGTRSFSARRDYGFKCWKAMRPFGAAQSRAKAEVRRGAAERSNPRRQ